MRRRAEQARREDSDSIGVAGLLPCRKEVGLDCSFKRTTRDGNGVKSQVGPSFGNNFNNRSEEAIGSATDLWVAFREGRLGSAPPPFLGYFFLLEDCTNVRRPVGNKEPYFKVDPVFREASYSRRYEVLCRRLVLERVYSGACFVMATNSAKTRISEPASDLSFARFVAALRGHAVTFLGSQSA